MTEPCKPNDPISGWTVETLFHLLNERRREMLLLLDERDRRMEERFIAQEKTLAQAENDLRAWKSSQNEWRGTFTDITARFVTIDRYEAANLALVDRYEQGHALVVTRQDDVIARVSRLEGQEAKGQINTTTIVMWVGVLVAFVSAIVALFKSGAL